MKSNPPPVGFVFEGPGDLEGWPTNPVHEGFPVPEGVTHEAPPVPRLSPESEALLEHIRLEVTEPIEGLRRRLEVVQSAASEAHENRKELGARISRLERAG